MKRRNFIKTFTIVLFSVATGNIPNILIAAEPTNYDLFHKEVMNNLADAVGIPIEIIEMKFNTEWSLSREMLLYESKYWKK